MKEGWMKNDEKLLKNDEGWKMNDERQMMKDESWRMKDEKIDFKLFEGFGLWQTNEQMNGQTDICDCRVAFATENWIKKENSHIYPLQCNGIVHLWLRITNDEEDWMCEYQCWSWSMQECCFTMDFINPQDPRAVSYWQP